MDLIIICGDDAPSGPIRRVHPKRRVGGAKGKLHLSAREWQFRLNFYCCLGCLRGVYQKRNGLSEPKLSKRLCLKKITPSFCPATKSLLLSPDRRRRQNPVQEITTEGISECELCKVILCPAINLVRSRRVERSTKEQMGAAGSDSGMRRASLLQSTHTPFLKKFHNHI